VSRRGPARAVVRLERSGRGGKAVTVVEHLGLPAAERDAWLKALKAALGCGGSVDGESLVLQGDQRSRLPAALSARGVRKVTLG
jgi:translation initiation factor 1